MNNTDMNKNLKFNLYNDVLSLVEEEIYQRKSGSSYEDMTSTKQTGGYSGGFKIGGAIPGKFDVVRNSLEIPLNIAVRGTIARQQLFAKENNIVLK